MGSHRDGQRLARAIRHPGAGHQPIRAGSFLRAIPASSVLPKQDQAVDPVVQPGHLCCARIVMLRGRQPAGRVDRPTGRWAGNAMDSPVITRPTVLAVLAGAAVLESGPLMGGCGRSRAAG